MGVLAKERQQAGSKCGVGRKEGWKPDCRSGQPYESQIKQMLSQQWADPGYTNHYFSHFNCEFVVSKMSSKKVEQFN